MGIFDSIKYAIFGDHGVLGTGIGATPAATNTPGTAAPAQPAAPAPSAAAPSGERPAMPQMASPAGPAGSQPGGQGASPQPVDVETVLAGIAHRKGDPHLDWRNSIVDLMKLLDLDPSLHNREELAGELGYGGAKDGSAEMNIWLHRRVMEELARSGGSVPADLKA